MKSFSGSNFRVVDTLLTNVVHGYGQGEMIAPFLAPPVSVPTRSGKIIKHTKDNFILTDTRRVPGSDIKYLSPYYTSESYTLNQHAKGGSVPFEYVEEALNAGGGDKEIIDLRIAAAKKAYDTIMIDWERTVIDYATSSSNYESTNFASVAPANQFSASTSDVEALVLTWQEAIRAQTGSYANSAVIDSFSFNALKLHPIFRDRVKYTSSASITLDMVAEWLGLSRGIKVASAVYFDPQTGKFKDIMPKGTMVLFNAPTGELSRNILPTSTSDRYQPAAFYTYVLDGYPVVEETRENKEKRTYVNEVIVEQSVVGVGLGETDKIGAAFLAKNLVS